MSFEYVLVTVIQSILVIMMAVITLRQCRMTESLTRHMETLIQINRLQEHLIDHLMKSDHDGKGDAGLPEEGYR